MLIVLLRFAGNKARVSQDPFVAENVVSAEIMEITPASADERLSCLLG